MKRLKDVLKWQKKKNNKINIKAPKWPWAFKSLVAKQFLPTQESFLKLSSAIIIS